MVLPEIVKAVNTAPEYAKLRRAFLARIVAEWIRTRHRSGDRTSFDKLLDSRNLEPAKLQGDWTPRQVFDAYVRSIKEGEFTYKRTTRQGRNTLISTFVFGGVDFSKVPMNRVSAAQMSRQHPRLPQTVQASMGKPASASDGSIWLGETAESPSRGLWTRATDLIGKVMGGRAGTLAVILLALGVLIFGFRSGSRHRRRTAS